MKHARTIHHKDTKSLLVFCEDYPEATPILLYQGQERLKIGEVLCLPVETFLKQLVPGKELIS